MPAPAPRVPDLHFNIEHTHTRGRREAPRFFRICSLKFDFIRVSLDFLEVLARKNYPISLLRRYVNRFIRRHRYLYGTKSASSLVKDLFRDLSRRLAV